MAVNAEGIGRGVLIGTLSTVCGAIVIAIGLRAFGYFPKVWQWIAGAFVWLWHLLTFPVPMPLAVLLVAAGAVVYSLRVHYRTNTGAPGSSPEKLSADEDAIVRLLAKLDGEWAGFDDIATRIRRPKLITERALDQLHARSFIAVSRGTSLYPPTFRLAPEGVEYACGAGYLQ